MNRPPDIGRVGNARREILKRELYNYRGVQMLDLVHASRGCKFNCFPCCSGFLGGRKFRPRPIDKVISEMGCWYVYQAIFDTSDVIRDRIKMLKDYEIGIEGTIILGLDDQDVAYIKRLVDFLCENEVDVAEFTILTPFPHSHIRHHMEKDGRILQDRKSVV